MRYLVRLFGVVLLLVLTGCGTQESESFTFSSARGNVPTQVEFVPRVNVPTYTAPTSRSLKASQPVDFIVQPMTTSVNTTYGTGGAGGFAALSMGPSMAFARTKKENGHGRSTVSLRFSTSASAGSRDLAMATMSSTLLLEQPIGRMASGDEPPEIDEGDTPPDDPNIHVPIGNAGILKLLALFYAVWRYLKVVRTASK